MKKINKRFYSQEVPYHTHTDFFLKYRPNEFQVRTEKKMN